MLGTGSRTEPSRVTFRWRIRVAALLAGVLLTNCPIVVNGQPIGTPTPTTQLATKTLQKAAVACQKVIAQVSAKIVADKFKALDACANVALSCVQTKLADPTCLAKAGKTCAKQLTKATAALPKAQAKIVTAKSCAKELRLPDLLSADGLALGAVVGQCQSNFNLNICVEDADRTQLSKLAECLVRTHEDEAGALYGAARPRTGELLKLLRLPPVEGLPTFQGCNECGTPDGPTCQECAGRSSSPKAIEQCAHALTKTTQTLVAKLDGTYGACAQKVLACVQTNTEPSACLTKTKAGCDKGAEKISQALGKFQTAIAKKCGTDSIDFGQLASAAGLNVNALAGSCSSLGVSAPTDVDTLATCLQQQATCSVSGLVHDAIARVGEFEDPAESDPPFTDDLPTPCPTAAARTSGDAIHGARFNFGSILTFVRQIRLLRFGPIVKAPTMGGAPTSSPGAGRGVTSIHGPARVSFGGIVKIPFTYHLFRDRSQQSELATSAPTLIVTVQHGDFALDDHFEIALDPTLTEDQLEVAYQDTLPACAFTLALAIADKGVISDYTPLLQVVDAAQPTPSSTPAVSFAAASNFAAGSVPLSVAVVDVNGDGRADLLVANQNSGDVSVLLNATAPGAGSASFAAAANFAAGANPQSVAAADVNGDGHPDLIVANALSNDVAVLLNTTAPGAASPSFAAAGNFTAGSNPNFVATADVNGDGRPDLLVANFNSGDVSVLLNTTAPGDTSPSFGTATNFGVGSVPVSVAVADLNGDGLPDMVVANSNSGEVSVLLNTTAPGAVTPSFSAASNFTAGTSPRSVAVADINGDGRPDVLVANEGSDEVSVLLNTTAPGAASPSLSAAENFAAGTRPAAVAAMDVNGDGRFDIVVTNVAPNDVSVLLNTTTPGAASPSFAASGTFAVEAPPLSVAAMNVNGDGRPDVIVANSSGDVSVLVNTTPQDTAPPSFAAGSNFGAGANPQFVTLADVEGDGRPDLIVANFGSNDVSVLLNSTAPGAGSASFAAASNFAVGTSPLAAITADLNGDGRRDLIVANVNSGNVSVLLNTTTPGAAAPSFAAGSDFAAGAGPASVATSDVNGDGLLDLLVANRNSDNVSVLLNTTAPGAASASFAAAANFAVPGGPFSLAAADVNGDGRPDVLVANISSGNVSVLLNTTAPGDSSPNFTAASNFAAGTSPNSVAVADINGDGRPDFIVANYTSSNVSVLLNTTAPGAVSPSFAAASNFAAGAGASSVTAVDVSGDGRPDLVVANFGSGNISVLVNATAPGAVSPSFAGAINFAAGSFPISVAAADVNGDGGPDILVGNYGSANVSVILNTRP